MSFRSQTSKCSKSDTLSYAQFFRYCHKQKAYLKHNSTKAHMDLVDPTTTTETKSAQKPNKNRNKKFNWKRSTKVYIFFFLLLFQIYYEKLINQRNWTKPKKK